MISTIHMPEIKCQCYCSYIKVTLDEQY